MAHDNENDEEYEDLDNSPDDFDKEMGSGIDPVEEARKPRQRRGLFIALSGFAIIVALIMVVALRSKGGAEASATAKADTLNQGRAIAASAPVIDVATPAVSLQQVDTTQILADTSKRLIDENALTIRPSPATGNGTNNGTSNGVSSNFPSAGSVMASVRGNTPDNNGAGNGTSTNAYETGVPSMNVVSTRPSPRQMAAARAAAKWQNDSARADAYTKWVATEKTRLNKPTQVSLGGDSEGSAGGAAGSTVGQSRFGSSGQAGSTPTTGGSENTSGGPNDPSAGNGADNNSDVAGASQVINGIAIPPGARVRAVTMTEYRSDIEGDQTLQIQLQEPLRAGGRTVLPAGTIGYGKVSSTAGSAGRSPYVQVSITTFQTRQGQVIRGVQAQAGDPETYAMAIKGKTDRRLGERVARGIAAGVLDIGFAAGSQRVADRIAGHAVREPGLLGSLVAAQPSPTDVALLRTQDRLQPLISAAVGDENSIAPAVILKKGTPFLLFFGF